MKKYFKYLYYNLIKLIVILCVCFSLSFLLTDLINKQRSFYSATFTVDNVEAFDFQLLTDKEFLNEIKDSGANEKYKNIDVDKMLEKEDFSFYITENEVTINTKYKYYDLFFLSSNNTVGTRAKMYIKDVVTAIAKTTNTTVIFENPNDIVTLNKSINRWKVSLLTFLTTLLIEFIFSIIFYNKQKDSFENNRFVYDNETSFATCFHKKYWKLAFRPLNNVKDITTIAMLFALMLASKFIPIPSGFGNLGLSFTYLFFSVIAMIYGPIYGFVIGIFSDVIGFFLPNSGGGIFNLGYTLQAAMCGFIYGICFFKTKVSFSKALFARFLVNIFMNAIYGSFLFIFVTYVNSDASMTMQSYLEKVKYYFLLLSLPKNILYLIPQSILLYYVLKVVSPILYRFKLVGNNSLNK